MNEGMKVRINVLGIILLVFILGGAGLLYKGTIGKANKDLDRKIFKQSKSYVEGKAEDLAKYKLELATTTDKIERKAIIDFILENYGNFDENKIENRSLRNFLIDVRNGNIK